MRCRKGKTTDKLMKLHSLLLLALAGSMAARADFSYTMTRKTAQGPGEATKTSVKGQKMMIESSSTTTILDFEAQTITSISKSRQTYSVRKFSDIAAATGGMTVTADAKETGQKKVINGFNASELVMTVNVDMPSRGGNGPGMKAQMEMHIWISPDVPGAGELRAFYARNSANFPWSAMAAGGNPSMAKAMGDLQRKLSTMHGVPVLEVMKMNMGGAGASGITPERQAQMDQARARLEQMQQQGGPAAQAAAQALARMNAAGGGAGGMETTMEAGNFSTSAIPDSAFSIPAGYAKSEK